MSLSQKAEIEKSLRIKTLCQSDPQVHFLSLGILKLNPNWTQNLIFLRFFIGINTNF